MHNITRKSTVSLIFGFIFFSISFTSCYFEPYDFDYTYYVDNLYSVSGYLYPFGYPQSAPYYFDNVGLDIVRTGYNKVDVSLYTAIDYFQPFENLECLVEYDDYYDAYRIYRPYYGNAMTLLVYDNGYVRFDFNYSPIDYLGRPYAYFLFKGHVYPNYYKAASKDSISSRPVNIKPE